MEIKHKKEVDYETVDQPNTEQSGWGGKGKSSPLINNKNSWLEVALLAILVALIILFIVSNGK